MPDYPPYLTAPGTLTRALQQIKAAATPDRFTYDYMENTLGLKGGSARPVVPFLKRTGFIGSDGSPTDLYKRSRNPSETGQAAAEGLKTGYRVLFDMNEKAHELSDESLKGLVVQATGLERDSPTVRAIVGSFKVLKSLTTFAPVSSPAAPESQQEILIPTRDANQADTGVGINLSYTINLNLPATADVSVFNAIFKSLKENLLKK
jgi:hypothetical protein